MSPSCVLYYLIINHRQMGQPVPFWLKPKVFGPSALLTALRFKRDRMASQLSRAGAFQLLANQRAKTTAVLASRIAGLD